MVDRADALATELLPLLPAGTRVVLDVGSGTGHNVAAIRRRLPDAAYVECDVADFHVVGNGPIVVRGGRMPFRSASIDVCLLQFILQYPDDPASVLAEVRRVAGIDGVVIVRQTVYRGPVGKAVLAVSEFVWGPLAYAVARLCGAVPGGASTGLRPRRYFSEQDLVALCESAGFRCESEQIVRKGTNTCYDVILVLK